MLKSKSAEGEIEGKEHAPSVFQATRLQAKEEGKNTSDLACDVVAFKAKGRRHSNVIYAVVLCEVRLV